MTLSSSSTSEHAVVLVEALLDAIHWHKTVSTAVTEISSQGLSILTEALFCRCNWFYTGELLLVDKWKTGAGKAQYTHMFYCVTNTLKLMLNMRRALIEA